MTQTLKCLPALYNNSILRPSPNCPYSHVAQPPHKQKNEMAELTVTVQTAEAEKHLFTVLHVKP